MSLSLKSKVLVAASAFAAFNAGFLADAIQAHKAAYAPDGTGDVVKHMYAKKIMESVFNQYAKQGDVAGVILAGAVFHVFALPGTPGIVAGEYLGEALYKPVQNQPSSP